MNGSTRNPITNEASNTPIPSSQNGVRPKSRQVLRAEALRAEKDARHREIVNKRYKHVFEKQSKLILACGMNETEENEVLEFLEEILEQQKATNIESKITGIPNALLDRLVCQNKDDESTEQTRPDDYLKIPSTFTDFTNTSTHIIRYQEQRVVAIVGRYREPEGYCTCPNCGKHMEVKDHRNVILRHVPIGDLPSVVVYKYIRHRCNDCEYTTPAPEVGFKAGKNRITKELKEHIRSLCQHGFTLKDVSELTGAHPTIVKDIDMERLQELYTIDGETLIKPEKQARYLGIDEFKLHNGRRYATIIIDLDSGHALWLKPGKTKEVVYSFFEHVGDEWMKGVKAVACDMNADFSDAFKKRYPHIRVVFDYFHIIKNFNDKVINEVRKDEQERLIKEGKLSEAKTLKRCKYIVMASKKTLEEWDRKAGETRRKGSKIFGIKEEKRKGGRLKRYEAILQENKLLFTCDIIKEKLTMAYKYKGGKVVDRLQMGRLLHQIMDLCNETQNAHFLWFKKLIKDHYRGIIAHATYPITSGKVEGTNQMIKTIRREAYGLPDDEYFFLKIMDATRHNPEETRRFAKLKTILSDAQIQAALRAA